MNKFKTSLFMLLCCLLLALTVRGQKQDDRLTLWYTKPASIWEEALPLGNAKTGAMVFGGINIERYQLNDNTLWSGFPNPGNNDNGPKVLPEVRKAMFNGDYEKAAALWKKMQGPYSARYLPLGDLLLDFGRQDTTTTYYKRDLNLQNATSTVKYTYKGVTYTRETFTSWPDKVMAIKITADKPHAIRFKASLTSKLKYQTKSVEDNYLVLRGKAPKFVANRDYESNQIVYDKDLTGEGMNFEVHLRVKAAGGKVHASADKLVVTDASTVTLFLTEATSFNGFDKSPGLAGKDPAMEATSLMNKVMSQQYEDLKRTHVEDYTSLFQRVSIDLGTDVEALKLPINERMLRLAFGKTDNALQALYYQFGRYLLISSSRPGSRPANLQGIWNDKVQPPWGSNYTTNINTEMNYWLAENTNLSECHQPLFDFMNELAINGAITAKVNYNIQKGWVTHHNSDLWAKTSPPGGYEWDPKGMPRWSAWPMAGAWFCSHLWEHYLFTGDQVFLKEEAYPLMKGAAEFMLSWLIDDPNSNYLITNPATSPENTVKIKGKEYQLSMATTMDMAIIRELFTACIKTSTILNIDGAFRAKLEKAKARLYPYQIGQYGQLQEWYQDWDDPKDQHRHISQLFGLYPGNQISVKHTPELAAAAKQSLIHRGDVSTGWSMAWKTNWWARLQDGNHAYKILKDALRYIDPKLEKEQMSGGGAYPNLFDAHPPFQIDGNFGATAGMTEMLLQSHAGEIQLLPALPDAWPTGSIKGIKARGNFTVDIDWNQGNLRNATIEANVGGNCRLRTPIPVKVVEITTKTAQGNNGNVLTQEPEELLYKRNGTASLQKLNIKDTYVLDFQTEKGKRYTIVPL
ncbi:glycoside hydrolase family 95 protein [Olivibacter domesticus]|uniref:Alpha-L-fucosidase 2 n=1 Tax=Olivibacter domesticus TaxID=407022 RepID=A0A1H7QFQ5_OLID1|nr:glycoside hydrolase family 95 protein [Olivibacter domesticus]SEL46649.1 alpha-L-fucosidase 2 [Olivibacter domesticus]